MSNIPDTVRFHFARQAPSPWNWYTKPDFAGCRLYWTAPREIVASYTIFRSNENLPSDCCEDLLNGYFDDVAERIDIFEPICELVDDEIHDKNRYLVLAHLENEDIIWIEDVESEQFVPPAIPRKLTYWSNPFGDKPRAKDPTHLDYSTIRVETFCGLQWDYPSQFPDYTGFELIVSDMPYSPHTGADSDIAAFRNVLNGSLGTHYQLDRFVNAVVDNESFLNRFWYYALLVKLPESGRVQIPLRHTDVPFQKGTPFQNLRPRPSWGEGRDKMMAAFARWKNELALNAASKSDCTTDLCALSLDDIKPKLSVHLDFFAHAPNLTFDSYRACSRLIGTQFSAMVAEDTEIIAIRSQSPLSDTECARILRDAHENSVSSADNYDAFAFVPRHGYMVLVDPDCHNKSNYAFAIYDKKTDSFSELSHVKDTTIDFIPARNEMMRWGQPGQPFSRRVAHWMKTEAFEKGSALTLQFNMIDESGICGIELYRFERDPDWSEDKIDDVHSFMMTGSPALGDRFVIDHLCHEVIDDVSGTNRTYYYAAFGVDANQNRMEMSVFNIGSSDSHEVADRLSDIVGTADNADMPEQDNFKRSSAIQSHSQKDKDDANKYSSADRFPSSNNDAPRRRHFSWDDDADAVPDADLDANDDAQNFGRSAEVQAKSEILNQVDASEIAEPEIAETQTESADRFPSSDNDAPRRRHFSWDDDADAVPDAVLDANDDAQNFGRSAEVQAKSEILNQVDASEIAETEIAETQTESADRLTSSDNDVPRRRHFSWDDDADAVPDADLDANDDAQNFGRSAEVQAKSEILNQVDASEITEPEIAETQTASADRLTSSDNDVPRRRRFSWDDDSDAVPDAVLDANDDAQNFGRSAEVQAKSEILNQVDASEITEPEIAETQTESADRFPSSDNDVPRRRHFSWDDDSDAVPDADPDTNDDAQNFGRSAEVQANSEILNQVDASEIVEPEIAETQTESAERLTSSDNDVPRRRHFSWDDDSDAVPDADLDANDDAQNFGRSAEVQAKSEILNQVDASEIAEPEIAETQTESADRFPSSDNDAPRRRHFSWDDDSDAVLDANDDAQNFGRSAEVQAKSEILNQVDASEIAELEIAETQTESADRFTSSDNDAPRRRHFSWDDDSDAVLDANDDAQNFGRSAEVQAKSEILNQVDASEIAEPEIAETQTASADRLTSSDNDVPRRRHFSWDDDADADLDADLDANDDAQNFGRSAEVQANSEILNQVDASEIAEPEIAETQTASADRFPSSDNDAPRRRHFSWDDDSDAVPDAVLDANDDAQNFGRSAEVQAKSEILNQVDASEIVEPEIAETQTESAERLTSSDNDVPRRRHFSWDDDSDAVPDADLDANDDAQNFGRSAEVQAKSEILNQVDASEIAEPEIAETQTESADRLTSSDNDVLRRRHFSWDDDADAVPDAVLDANDDAQNFGRSDEVQAESEILNQIDASGDNERQELGDTHEAAEPSCKLNSEDREILCLLAECRQDIENGDLLEAHERILSAKAKYADNLRIEAFEWNYLR